MIPQKITDTLKISRKTLAERVRRYDEMIEVEHVAQGGRSWREAYAEDVAALLKMMDDLPPLCGWSDETVMCQRGSDCPKRDGAPCPLDDSQ
jgi:hypothetical protein